MAIAMMPDHPPELHGFAAGKCGSGTFMPHRPVSTVSGMNIVDTTVSTFITSFSRSLTLVRWASRMPVIRSWKIIASSERRTSWS